MIKPHYDLTARVKSPQFERIRRYLLTEREFVQARVAGPQRWWHKLSVPSLGVYGRADWRTYGRELDHFERRVSRHAEDLHTGLVPLKFMVWHNGSQPDDHIRVHLEIKGGTFMKHKKAPHPPTRLDGGADSADGHHLPKIGRFTRTGVKITPHHVSVELSGLKPHDSAALLHDTLHVQADKHTVIEYAVHSNRVALERGVVRIVDR
jgi:hypothetical protein